MLRLCLLLPIAACAAPKPQIAVSRPAPAYTGTIVSIRTESTAQDPTGALQQIASILGQPAPQPLTASEIVLRMPDGTIKTSVQPPSPALTAGGKAAITSAGSGIKTN